MKPPFFIVDEFLHDALPARALQAAFELGIIDQLAAADMAEGELEFGGKADRAGADFLLQMLRCWQQGSSKLGLKQSRKLLIVATS